LVALCPTFGRKQVRRLAPRRVDARTSRIQISKEYAMKKYVGFGIVTLSLLTASFAMAPQANAAFVSATRCAKIVKPDTGGAAVRCESVRGANGHIQYKWIGGAAK
jgi:hypothetical protein